MKYKVGDNLLNQIYCKKDYILENDGQHYIKGKCYYCEYNKEYSHILEKEYEIKRDSYENWRYCYTFLCSSDNDNFPNFITTKKEFDEHFNDINYIRKKKLEKINGI